MAAPTVDLFLASKQHGAQTGMSSGSMFFLYILNSALNRRER